MSKKNDETPKVVDTATQDDSDVITSKNPKFGSKKSDEKDEESAEKTPTNEQTDDEEYEYVPVKHRALKVIACILAVIIVLGCVFTVIGKIGVKGNLEKAENVEAVDYSKQLEPVLEDDGMYCFTTDRTFKVMQLTDIHLGGGWLSASKDSSAITAVETMVREEKPDLVIVTGDIAYPVPFQAGTFNNKPPAQVFAELMESLGVYWTLGFGNHDTEMYSRYTREELSDLYESEDYPHCLFLRGPDDVDGYGNQVIKVRNSAGYITQLLIVLDSHSYTNGDFLGIRWQYDNIHKNQVQWYEQMVEKYEAENTLRLFNDASEKEREKYGNLANVKSMLFFHIPLTEYLDAWTELAENGYKDTEDVKYVTGMVGETGKAIYCGIGDDDLFEKVLELGSTQAIFCGHDHFNNFTVNYKGVDLVYGYSVDYLAYIGIKKKGSQRGCTMISIEKDGSYSVDKYNLYSGRYDLPDGFADSIKMQFEGILYQYFEDEEVTTAIG